MMTAAMLTVIACGCDDDSSSPRKPVGDPVVVIETSLGDITVELCRTESPISVANFLKYVQEFFYDGLIFHRVISNFMIQTGALDENMQLKPPTHNPISNEANNGLSNVAGTVSMARYADPHSATCQFFINVRDNAVLDYRDDTAAGWGYCVFGRVIEGMDVVDVIRSVETTSRDGYNDVPVNPVIIKRLYRKS